jgi:hypothetical protein
MRKLWLYLTLLPFASFTAAQVGQSPATPSAPFPPTPQVTSGSPFPTGSQAEETTNESAYEEQGIELPRDVLGAMQTSSAYSDSPDPVAAAARAERERARTANARVYTNADLHGVREYPERSPAVSVVWGGITAQAAAAAAAALDRNLGYAPPAEPYPSVEEAPSVQPGGTPALEASPGYLPSSAVHPQTSRRAAQTPRSPAAYIHSPFAPKVPPQAQTGPQAPSSQLPTPRLPFH